MARKTRAVAPAQASVPEVWPADQVQRWAVEDLVPYAQNARRHSDAQVEQIVRAIVEFGWTVPILVREDGTIIAGHGRILAAAKLGIAEVPVMVARGWSEAKCRAYTLLDNRLAENSSWDDELLRIEVAGLFAAEYDTSLLGWNAKELEQLTSAVSTDPASEWDGMPEFDQSDKTAFRTLPVHFKDQAAVDAFAELIGQKITDRTRFVWYPEIEIERYADKRYAAERGDE